MHTLMMERIYMVHSIVVEPATLLHQIHLFTISHAMKEVKNNKNSKNCHVETLLLRL